MRRADEWRPQWDLNRVPGDQAFIRHVAGLRGIRDGFRWVDAVWVTPEGTAECRSKPTCSVPSWQPRGNAGRVNSRACRSH
jgi:hypothetical protein